MLSRNIVLTIVARLDPGIRSSRLMSKSSLAYY